MSSCAVGSVIDVALWFQDKARHSDSYLRPLALQRYLYLAYGLYGAANYGRKLMPAFFLVDDSGPFEPNIRRLFAFYRPGLEIGSWELPSEVERFLEDVWRCYQYRQDSSMEAKILNQEPVLLALARLGKHARRLPEELAHEDIVQGFVTLAKKGNRSEVSARVRGGDSWPLRGRAGGVDPTMDYAQRVRLPGGRVVKKWRPGARVQSE